MSGRKLDGTRHHRLLRAAVGAGLVLCLLAQPGPAAAMTVQEYLDAVGRQEAASTLGRYFVGMSDGLFAFNDALSGAGIRVFCPPAGEAVMEAEELRRRVDAVVRERQETRPDFATYAATATIGLTAIEILNEIYPCDEGEEAPAPNDP